VKRYPVAEAPDLKYPWLFYNDMSLGLGVPDNILMRNLGIPNEGEVLFKWRRLRRVKHEMK
jgi:hypothetical protein